MASKLFSPYSLSAREKKLSGPVSESETKSRTLGSLFRQFEQTGLMDTGAHVCHSVFGCLARIGMTALQTLWVATLSYGMVE